MVDRRKAARLLFQLPYSCRVYTKLQPSNQWGWAEVLANKTNYLLELLLWQNSDTKNKAKHKRNKPKPYVPDFMKKALNSSGINEGVQVQTIDDVKSWLAVPRG